MTAQIYPYLTFENAKEAMDYYVQNFDAEMFITSHLVKSKRKTWDWILTR